MNYLTEFKIQQLRTKNMTAAVESIAVIVGAVVANMLVPQLLLKYVYTDTSAMLEAPAIFTYFPLATYTLALAYFLRAMVSNFVRNSRADNLEKELVLTGGHHSHGCCDDCSDDEEISDDELKELEKIVDQALKPNKKTTKLASKRSITKKSAKKSK